jgi:hypothetical protein
MNEDEDILQALADNRVKIKVKIRKRWEDSENVTAEIMLYKLTADEEELRRLSVTKSEVSGTEGKPLDISIQVLGNDAPILEEPNED